MASWDTEIIKATLTGNDEVSRVKTTASDVFSNTTKKSIADVENCFATVSVVGMNANKISEMQNKISDYIKEVEAALANFQNYDPTIAFKGSQAIALTTYIDEIKAVCNNVCSYMNVFSDDLQQILKAYQSKDEALQSSIQTDASNTKSAFSNSYYASGSGAGAVGSAD